jgi:hypothetical protein
MKHLYTLLRIGLHTNCSNCDAFTNTNTYERDDELIVDLCNRCQVQEHA